MKTKRLVCRNCGYEGDVPILTPEEAENLRRKREPLGPVRCPKCHATTVQLYD